MSLEALKKIAQAENEADRAWQECQADARKLIADAEAAGRERLNEIQVRSEAESKKLYQKSESRAAVSVEESRRNTEAECARLREQTQERLDVAADLIVERIVSG